MPTGNPPSYDAAITQSPKNNEHNHLGRSRTNETISTVSSDGDAGAGLIDDETRISMDDERRDLPQGWVRCFDPKTGHHFYVEEATKRSIWM